MKRFRRKKELSNIFNLFYKNVDVKDASFGDITVWCSSPHLQEDMTREYGHNKGVDSDEAIAFTVSHLVHAYLFNKYGITVEKPCKEQDHFTFRISNAYLPRRK